MPPQRHISVHLRKWCEPIVTKSLAKLRPPVGCQTINSLQLCAFSRHEPQQEKPKGSSLRKLQNIPLNHLLHVLITDRNITTKSFQTHHSLDGRVLQIHKFCFLFIPVQDISFLPTGSREVETDYMLLKLKYILFMFLGFLFLIMTKDN